MRDPNMKEKTVFERPVSRRRVLTASALLAAAGFASSPLAAAVANAVADFGVYEWTACVINCGQRCPLRAYTKNGTVIRIETDNTVKDGCRVRQLRACLKGRDMRERLYSPDRLKYPMKRVGERSSASPGTRPSRPSPTSFARPSRSMATNRSIGSTARASSRSSTPAEPGGACSISAAVI